MTSAVDAFPDNAQRDVILATTSFSNCFAQTCTDYAIPFLEWQKNVVYCHGCSTTSNIHASTLFCTIIILLANAILSVKRKKLYNQQGYSVRLEYNGVGNDIIPLYNSSINDRYVRFRLNCHIGFDKRRPDKVFLPGRRIITHGSTVQTVAK